MWGSDRGLSVSQTRQAGGRSRVSVVTAVFFCRRSWLGPAFCVVCTMGSACVWLSNWCAEAVRFVFEVCSGRGLGLEKGVASRSRRAGGVRLRLRRLACADEACLSSSRGCS